MDDGREVKDEDGKKRLSIYIALTAQVIFLNTLFSIPTFAT